MLNFDPTDEQALLSSSLNKIILDHYGNDAHAAHLKEDTGFSLKLWNTLSENGFFSLHLPEDVGGFSGSIKDIALVMTELGKSVAVEPVLVGPVLSGLLIDAIGSAEQRMSWLPQIMDGSKHVSLAHIEKKSRFRLDKVETQYTGSDGNITLSGKKIFALGSGTADVFIVSAIPDNASVGDGSDVQFFLVQASADGIAQQKYRLTDGSIASDLTLTNVPAEHLSGGCFEDFSNVISFFKVAVCAEMVGVLDRLFQDTLEYVKTRKQFGKPIGSFQVIQHRLSDHFASLELCKSHLFRMFDQDPTTPEGKSQIAGSKAFISQTAMELAEDAVQLHGGMGITDELIIGRGLKRIMVLSSLFGDAPTENKRFQ